MFARTLLTAATYSIVIGGALTCSRRFASNKPLLMVSEQQAVMGTSSFNPLGASATDVQIAVKNGELTYESYAALCLDQIARHNHAGLHLNAVISTVRREDILSIARLRDEQRAKSNTSAHPLFGLPLLVKDVFQTPSSNVDTTCGSYALRNAKAKRDAAAIERLQRLGMIVIAKTNLSEWGALKGNVSGWSAVGGQTQTPFVEGGVAPNATFLGHTTPAGSSSGSAVGVAAGFAPLSIGTESDGSLVCPGIRASLYSLKGTPGSINLQGSQPVSPAYDCMGALAKTPRDLAVIMGALQHKDYESNFTTHGLRLGFVDPDLWQPAEFVTEPNHEFRQQTDLAMNEAMSKLKTAGVQVHDKVHLISYEDSSSSGGEDLEALEDHDIPQAFKEWFATYLNPPVKSLEDLITFNREHADLELPKGHDDQNVLEGALKSTMSDEEYHQKLSTTRSRTAAAILDTLNTNNIQAIIGPGDGRMPSVAAQAGFLVGSLPLGLADFNGRAFGMMIIAPPNHEPDVLHVMHVWDKFVAQSRIPPLLANWTDGESSSRM